MKNRASHCFIISYLCHPYYKYLSHQMAIVECATCTPPIPTIGQHHRDALKLGIVHCLLRLFENLQFLHSTQLLFSETLQHTFLFASLHSSRPSLTQFMALKFCETFPLHTYFYCIGYIANKLNNWKKKIWRRTKRRIMLCCTNLH